MTVGGQQDLPGGGRQRLPAGGHVLTVCIHPDGTPAPGAAPSIGALVARPDLDDLVETIGGFVGLSGERFRQAQVVFGELVGAWIDQAFDVIAHGPFFDRDEDQALLHARPGGVTPRRVLLHAT